MDLDKKLGQWILCIALIIDFYLELKHLPVPTTIGVLAGFYLRHLMIEKPEVKI